MGAEASVKGNFLTIIAKNELAGGQDTEAGRQFNRRVELIVLNGTGEPMNIVDKIDVPDGLEAN